MYACRLFGWYKLLDKKIGSKSNEAISDDAGIDNDSCVSPSTQSSAFSFDSLTAEEASLANFDLQGQQPYSADDFNLLKVLGQGGYGKVSHAQCVCYGARKGRFVGVSGGKERYR
jgi:hypothetical protein